VQVGALTDWYQIANGSFFALAIKTNGTLWSWGSNGYGRLGQNDSVNRSSPVQVGALTTWLTLPKMSRTGSSLAIKSP
jgi:alpha-tubulin suppressor-like RCC1 family protein